MDKNISITALIEMINAILFKKQVFVVDVISTIEYLTSIKAEISPDLYKELFELILNTQQEKIYHS